MSEIKIIKTPWYKMIKLKRKRKKWNKKYAGKPLSAEGYMEAIRDF